MDELDLANAALVLTAGTQILPCLHPHMASERQGPTMGRQFEPPGFLALHRRVATPAAVGVAHFVFGAILGGFHRLS